MIIKYFNYEDFSNFMYDFNNSEWILELDQDDIFYGFRYFSPSCFRDNFLEKCLVAFEKEENPHNIIGIIWFGEYGFSVKDQAVSFIDVREDWKNKGIATALIKSLNNYIDHDRVMYISQLSDQGQACHIDKIFKEYLKTELKFN